MDTKDVTASQDGKAPSAFVAAARRELGEEAELPDSWLAAAEQEYQAHPRGHHPYLNSERVLRTRGWEKT